MRLLRGALGLFLAAVIGSACQCGGQSGPYLMSFKNGPRNSVAGPLGAIKVTIALKDSDSPPDGVDVTLALAPNAAGATLGGTLTVKSEKGLATFPDLTLTQAGDGYQLVVSAPGSAPVSSATFDVRGGPGASLEMKQNPTDGNAGGLIGPAPQVAMIDAYGNQASTDVAFTVALGANPGGGTLGGTTSVVSENGIATFQELSIDKPASGYTLVFSAPSLGTVTSQPFVVHPGLAARLAFSVQPSNSSAGAAIAPAVAVQLLDSLGNLVDDSATTVTLALSGGAAGAALSGQSAVTSHGVATFSSLAVNRSGTGYQLTADAAGLQGAQSDTFNIDAGAPSQLAFGAEPFDSVPGVALAPAVQVVLLDAQGNPTTAAVPVTVALLANPGGATLSGTLTRTSVAGVATFNDLTLDQPANGYTLAASAPGLTSATSQPFLINPTPPTAVEFQAQPSQAATGGTISPAVTVRVVDASSALVPTSNVMVTVSIANNPGGGALRGTLTRRTSGGVATFDDLAVNAPGNGYTLRANAGSLTAATSAAFNVTPPVLVYTDPPAGGKLRLVRNAASTTTTLVLDLVTAQALTGYAVGFDLPVDATRVALGATPLTPGTALNPGTAPVAAKAVIPSAGPFASVLVSGLSQKAAGGGAVATDTALGSGALLYTVRLTLTPTAQAGAVFDGSTGLPAGFKGALRDRLGNDVASSADFKIGRLDVQ